jgi:hypothetical protein
METEYQQLPVVAEPIMPAIPVAQVMARMNAIEELKKKTMRRGVDYGRVPGCPKDSLWVSGAEKLMMLFHLGIGEPQVEDLSHEGVVHYRVILPICSLATHEIIAYGVGECSSRSEKYAYRKVLCDAEWEAAPEDQRRIKWDKDGKETRQIKVDPANIANTILKMAKKSSFIDAILNATGGRAFFTQDLENLPDGMLETEEPGRKPRPNGGAAPAPGMVTEPQVKRLFAILHKDSSGKEENERRDGLLKQYLTDMGIAHTKDIPRAEYEGIEIGRAHV